MSIDTIRTAVAALEAAGTDVSIRTLQQELPDVGRSTLARHWATIRGERGHTQDPLDPSTATAVLEEGSEPDTAPDTLQAVQQAQAALEGARAHLKAVERSPALAMRLALVTAQRQGVITRSDPCWRDFDDAQQQLARATEEVARAEEALTRAQRQHQGQLRAQAEAAYSATEAGKAILQELARLQRSYADAAAQELGSVASYSHALSIERARFQEGVSKVLATMQPIPDPAPSGPPPRLSVAVLRPCYLRDDGSIGRVMPPGIARFEVEDYPALLSFREVLREELTAANRVYRDLEGDEAMSAAAWHDPRTLPLRQARQKTGVLHSAVQEISTDLRILQQRAASEGRTL